MLEDFVESEVKITLETLHEAAFGYGWRHTAAQDRIIQAVIAGLSAEDRERFEEYERKQDPCGSVEV